MNDLHLGSGGPPGQYPGAAGWRAVTRVLRSCKVLTSAFGVALADVTNTVFPSDCRTCGAPMVAFGKVRVCDDCVARVGPPATASKPTVIEQEILCSRCGDALGMESIRFGESLGITECTMCRLAPPEFTRAVAFANYDNEMREMLHLLKFGRLGQLANYVFDEHLAQAILKLRPQATNELVVVPVPLFTSRVRERGFNQALLLAQAAIKRLRKLDPTWQLRLQTRILSRVKDTQALYVLNPSQRRRNLRGAFRVIDSATVRGQEVLLLDDIMTTGATARECSRVLLAAGATKVWVATVARAQPEASQHQVQNVARWDVTPSSTRILKPQAGKRVTFI